MGEGSGYVSNLLAGKCDLTVKDMVFLCRLTKKDPSELLSEVLQESEYSKRHELESFANKLPQSALEEYAQALLNLLKAGKDTPINLEGTLSPDRYKFGNNTISGARYFGNNRMLNTFLIEKIYEEMLLAHGRKYQKNIQSFMRSFMSRLNSGGIEFVDPTILQTGQKKT